MEETLALGAARPTSGNLELSLAALRRRFAEAQRPQPAIFWADLGVSAMVGWSAFYLAGSLPAGSALSGVALVVAILALYRAVLFIHEITHLKPNVVRGFETTWNLLVGIPLMAPSLLYVGAHRHHHDVTRYGTDLDPEYEPVATWGPLRIASSFALMPLFPPALAVRWGVLGPLSRLIPALRPFVVGHLSTLAINPRYVRELPVRRDALRWKLEEAGGALWVWACTAAIAFGLLDVRWAFVAWAVTAGILFLNHARTLASHRYENLGGQLDWNEQLIDSVNIPGAPILTALAAPVGLRFHGLHHMLPGVPYHNLPAVHRALIEELPEDSPYRDTVTSGVLATLGQLFARSARNAQR